MHTAMLSDALFGHFILGFFNKGHSNFDTLETEIPVLSIQDDFMDCCSFRFPAITSATKVKGN